MKLIEVLTILAPLSPVIRGKQSAEHDFCNPVVDNRLVNPGDIFICIEGFSIDGHQLAADAVNRGAKLVVCQKEIVCDALSILVSDTRKAAALLAKLHYGNPSRSFCLVGITGTNGKTTSSLLIYQALQKLGRKTGWIGTLGYYIDEVLYQTKHTTPDIFELNQILAAMREHGVEYVVMEVSSHAIALDRIYGLEFDFSLFSNLSREHLDFHKTMEEYAETKFSFIEKYSQHGSKAIVNIDDSFGAVICDRLTQQNASIKCYGEKAKDYQIANIHLSAKSSKFDIRIHNDFVHIESKLIGRFNVQNLGIAVATLAELSFSPEEIVNVIKEIPPIKGRFERIDNDFGISVYIDYAHSPDAIENILKSCKQIPHNRLICVIGAGGDRDKGKRPLMLQAALHNSDAVLITDDNPRTENPDNIIVDMLAGTGLWFPWWIIRDRKRAIEAALKLANEGDIVVICGKGHENYQEIDGKRHHFDDREIAENFYNKTNATKASDELILDLDLVMIKLLINPDYRSEETLYTRPESFQYISTDSRSLKKGSAFFAIRGEKFDGHAFVSSVAQDRENLAIGEESFDLPNYLKCDNTLDILSSVMKKYLLMFGAYKIALTGSTGKSSTKEYLAAILSEYAPTLSTAQNENNMIGLARTILRIEPHHKFAVFEIGTNHFGEIATLSNTIIPDSGIILNIGPSHLEFLIDEDGVFREKKALFDRPLQYRFYPDNDVRFELYRNNGFSVGFTSDADYQITGVVTTNEGQQFMINNQEFRIKSMVPHNVTNASFAIACAINLGVPIETINLSLSRSIKLDKRMDIREINGKTIIIDCYNANPVSMQKSIEYWLCCKPESPHVAILGDMLELGANSNFYHQTIGAILSESSFNALYTIGHLSRYYKPEQLQIRYKHSANVDAILGEFASLEIDPNAVVLLKASHGLHLEKLIPYLTGEE